MSEALAHTIERHLEALVLGHPDRHPGRPGNTAANLYVESVFANHRWNTESTDFEALDCETGDARLTIEGTDYPILPGPYTTPVDAAGPLLPIDSLQALETADLAGSVVLLHGEIAADQLFPKSFDFVEAPEHRRIYALLECGGPTAVIGATGRGGGMGGGLYPYPLIEDGDFDIPTAYTTDVTGRELLTQAGSTALVSLEARRFTVPARQIMGFRGPSGAPRALVIAHVDSKSGTQGALDNAAGVAALLGVAQLLGDYEGPYRVELLPMNGEDYYANNGEHLFVEANEGRWEEIVGSVNMDAIGARGASTALSMYQVSNRGSDLIRRVVRRHPTVSIGQEWYESDHAIVAAHGRPIVALTSTNFRELCETITHTERDTLDLVDADVVAAAAECVADLIRCLPAAGGTEA